jgi:hypothetical protein
MTREELENLKPGTPVRLVGTGYVGLFVQLNPFGLAEIDGPAEAFDCCRTWDEIESLAQQPQWTREVPRVAGWYWLRGPHSNGPFIGELCSLPSDPTLRLWITGDDGSHDVARAEDGYEWCGPLEAPP